MYHFSGPRASRKPPDPLELSLPRRWRSLGYEIGIGVEVEWDEEEGERGEDVDDEDDDSGGEEGDDAASDGLSGEARECECCRDEAEAEWWW